MNDRNNLLREQGPAFPAFLPKAKKMFLCWQVFWLSRLLNTLPVCMHPDSGFIGSKAGQNGFGIYSYGDSAGLTPDFPFHHILCEPVRGKSRGLNLKVVLSFPHKVISCLLLVISYLLLNK